MLVYFDQTVVLETRLFQPKGLTTGAGTHFNGVHFKVRIRESAQLKLEPGLILLNVVLRTGLKVARTLADLADEDRIRVEHLAEAVQFRAPQE